MHSKIQLDILMAKMEHHVDNFGSKVRLMCSQSVHVESHWGFITSKNIKNTHSYYYFYDSHNMKVAF